MKFKEEDKGNGIVKGKYVVDTDSINTQIQKLKNEGGSSKDISDGYHTFEELYEHRYVLFVSLCNLLTKYRHDTFPPVSIDFGGNYYIESANVIKAKKHNDGTMFDDSFLVLIDSKVGQISYHLPLKYWNMVEAEEYDVSPLEWDGHTSNDVLYRLQMLFNFN
jgi:hypothetical protein